MGHLFYIHSFLVLRIMCDHLPVRSSCILGTDIKEKAGHLPWGACSLMKEEQSPLCPEGCSRVLTEGKQALSWGTQVLVAEEGSPEVVTPQLLGGRIRSRWPCCGISLPSKAEITGGLTLVPAISMNSEDLNSDLHACMADAYTAEPSRSPHFSFWHRF